jgi:DNA-binding NarL/FixJ family response regulator
MNTQYEETYAKLFHAQIKKDELENVRFREINKNRWALNDFKKKDKKIALTKQAKLVNKMLRKGWTQNDIAQSLGKSKNSIIQIQYFYNLPIKECLNT